MPANFPILDIHPSDGEESLLKHNLTLEEKNLFREIDSLTSRLPEDAPSKEYEKIAIEAGKKSGLTNKESKAFYIRATFRIFEKS